MKWDIEIEMKIFANRHSWYQSIINVNIVTHISADVYMHIIK